MSDHPFESAAAPPTTSILVRPSWRAVADAAGHCMLVFAYAPALVAIPLWLWFELHNPANLHVPVILAFAPIRGFLLLLDAFQLGAAAGASAGCLHGFFLSAWRWTHDGISTRRQRLVLGALGGVLAASLVMTMRLLLPIFRGGSPPPVDEIASGIAIGLLCGLLSTSTALRLLAPATD